jgi:transcriptional regulator with XRE-family HTH domain
MNETIAANIRRHRERLAWTQRQLAEAAKLNERTVQRAEDGTGLSAETLQAISGAFNVSVDDLRRDQVAEQVKATVAKYHVVHLEQLEHSSQFQSLLGGARGLYFDCVVRDDGVQDVAAELHQELRDCLDLWSELSETQKVDEARSLFAHVEALAAHGCVVTVGLESMRLRSEGASQPFSTTAHYVVISPEDDPKRFVMRDKKAAIQFA